MAVRLEPRDRAFPGGLGWMVPSSRPGAGRAEYEVRWRSAMVVAVAALGVRTLRFDLSAGSVRGLTEIVSGLRDAAGTEPSVVFSLPATARSGVDEGLSIARKLATDLGGTTIHLEVPVDLLPRHDPVPWELGPPFGSWGLDATAWASGRERETDELTLSAAWMRIPFHLLAGPAALSAVRWARSHGVPVVACDPFASGRLAGRAPADVGLRSSGASRPPDLRTLKSEWARVLALGFLTETGRRQLAEAAWQFLVGDPGIAGVWFEATDVGETMRIGAADRAAPLSEAERARVTSLMAGPPAGGAAASGFK